MESFIIEGGHRLCGTITPQGAKNEALQVIAATLLTEEEVKITNIPDILDINNLIKLMSDIGVKIRKTAKNLMIRIAENKSISLKAWVLVLLSVKVGIPIMY